MRNRLIIIFLTLLVLVGCRRSATVTGVHLVPEPLFMVQKEGTFVLDRNPRVSLQNIGQNSPTVQYILKSFRHSHIHPKLVARSDSPDIEVVLNDTANSELGVEGYLLEVHPTGIRLSANTEQGLFYAYQSLLQMLPPDVTKQTYQRVSLPVCTILDYPRFGWRGLEIDVASHYFNVKELRKVVDAMAMYKMNRLVLRLAGNEGCRLELEHSSKLTSDGGVFARSDMVDFVQYAAERGIEVVPLIPLQPVLDLLKRAYPSSLGCIQPGNVADTSVFCLGGEAALSVVSDLLDEVASLFSSSYLGLGNISQVSMSNPRCLRCQSRIRALHLDSEEALRDCYLRALVNHLDSVGRHPLFLVTDPQGATLQQGMMVVTDPVLAIKLARNKMDVVNASAAYCSFDRYQANSRYQPQASWGMQTLAQVYRFVPCPENCEAQVARYMRGTQCVLATEYITTPAELEYMLLPRLLAAAENSWTTPEQKDWMRFRQKVERQKLRLSAKDYTYCEGSFTPTVNYNRTSAGKTTVEITTEVPSTYIFYTTDGSTPTRGSNVYVGPMQLEVHTHLKVLPVYKGVERDTIYEFVTE